MLVFVPKFVNNRINEKKSHRITVCRPLKNVVIRSYDETRKTRTSKS